MEPLKPEHANKIVPVSGTEFSTRRILAGYSYPNHGNIENPTPRYTWQLLLDGKVVDVDSKQGPLKAAARRPGAAMEYRKG